MSFIVATSVELLKTKRTAAFWLCILSAAFIPSLFFLAYAIKPEGVISKMQTAAWNIHFMYGWQSLSAFLLPMFVILLCSLITQIEFKNNAWKQVFASPQSLGTIFFSKFVTIHLMIFFFYLLFNFFMIAMALLINLINSKFLFFEHSIDWQNLSKLNFKSYLSVLGISSIQYWLSLRFKNFIPPVGIGLGLLIIAIIARNFDWEHIYKVPFAHPLLSLQSMFGMDRPLIENHEWNSICYCILFLMIGFFDLKWRKEKG